MIERFLNICLTCVFIARSRGFEMSCSRMKSAPWWHWRRSRDTFLLVNNGPSILISLLILMYLPGTTFEDYWPAKGSIEALPNTRASAGAGNWTQKPAGQPNKMQVRLRVTQYI